MTAGYRSEQDRRVMEAYFRKNGITPIRHQEIGYDLEDRSQRYVFIASEMGRGDRAELTLRVVYVFDDGYVASKIVDYPQGMTMAEADFIGQVMEQRGLLTARNGRYRADVGPGVPKEYENVLQDILFAFQVGDYQTVEVDGRPAVQFSIYSCDPEYALEDYHAEFDRDRMTYTVYLDDPHGTGKVKTPPKKKDKPAKSAPGKTAPAKPKEKPKEKPKRKSTKSASDVQSRRSTRARTLDSKRRAKKTFPADYTDEQYALWAANPGRYDIEGIDTPKKVGSAQRRSSGSVGSRSTKSGVYTKQDWSRDRKFSAQPGQEVSAEVYEEMQYNGSPRYIPTALLERYGCIRGFLTGTMFADPEMYGAFGETADGRFLYLGLSKARKSYREGPATWMDDFYHEPKKKSAKKGASMASKARKSKVSTQPRNKQGRFMSREMAERPRKANGQFKKRTGARR